MRVGRQILTLPAQNIGEEEKVDAVSFLSIY